jgi:hypothetical protein
LKRRRLAKPLAIATSITGMALSVEEPLGEEEALGLRVLHRRDAELLLEIAAQVPVGHAERPPAFPGSRRPAARPRFIPAADWARRRLASTTA